MTEPTVSPEPSKKVQVQPKKWVTVSAIVFIIALVLAGAFLISWIMGENPNPNTEFAAILVSFALGLAGIRACIRIWDGRHGS